MTNVLHFIISGWLFLGWIDPFADQVRQGNELYKNGNYDKALEKYLNVQVNSPDVPQLSFNVADTQYKRGKYDEALKSFEKALKTGTPEMQAKTSFNIGNTLYKQGKMGEALDWYKKTVDIIDEITPKKGGELEQLKNDAMYNHEFVEKKLEEQQQQGQDNQQQQEQEQEQSEQEQQNDQNEGDDQSDENKEQEGKEQEPDGGNQPSEDKQEEDLNKEKEQPSHANEEQQQQQDQPPPQQQDAQTQEGGDRQMSKEEAERILDALNQAEKEARPVNREKQRQPHRSVEKDW
ncbi:MAG: hypothetical protein A2W17_00160 [Planctomycetes bacterium RBG_16_41_13]|nr:MAG: hypothetical protein A2W17_00160 [Planctomycetes bacterium RBG_16_41_13]